MAFVPCINEGYQPIFNAAEYRINIPQLVLNVLFATLLAALVFNLFRRRSALWMVAGILSVAGVWFGFSAFQDRMREEAEYHETIADLQIHHGKFDLAKQHLLKAADYWWWKGWWEGARVDKKQANDRSGMEAKHLPDNVEIRKPRRPDRAFDPDEILGPR